MEGNLPFLLCFTLYFRANSKYKPPGGGGGAYIWRGDLTEGFLRLGRLYLEGLIYGGAYFRNFTVFIIVFIIVLVQISRFLPR